jgi:hypothetical protein
VELQQIVHFPLNVNKKEEERKRGKKRRLTSAQKEDFVRIRNVQQLSEILKNCQIHRIFFAFVYTFGRIDNLLKRFGAMR